MRTKGVEPIHHLWYLALNQAWLPLHHIRILSGIIYCLLQACIVSTSLNPYLHLALSFGRNHHQVLFHPIWSVSWIFPSLLCRVDETRTRINVRIPNAAGQPITVLPYVIKKISHKPFLDLCEMSFWYFPGFLPYFFILVLSLFIFWWHTHTLKSELFPKTVATWLTCNSSKYHMCMQCHHNFLMFTKVFM